jgi:hypothetical protein
MCGAWQPDSPEEQERRREIAYIRLYGELAVDCLILIFIKLKNNHRKHPARIPGSAQSSADNNP